jgi:hypothetical protein
MTITEYAVTTGRAFMAAETAMAAVNCGAANVTRGADRETAFRFLCAGPAIPLRESNPLDTRV